MKQVDQRLLGLQKQLGVRAMQAIPLGLEVLEAERLLDDEEFWADMMLRYHKYSGTGPVQVRPDNTPLKTWSEKGFIVSASIDLNEAKSMLRMMQEESVGESEVRVVEFTRGLTNAGAGEILWKDGYRPATLNEAVGFVLARGNKYIASGRKGFSVIPSNVYGLSLVMYPQPIPNSAKTSIKRKWIMDIQTNTCGSTDPQLHTIVPTSNKEFLAVLRVINS
jgi:hypothetical protein